jgi:hypothetical protein
MAHSNFGENGPPDFKASICAGRKFFFARVAMAKILNISSIIIMFLKVSGIMAAVDDPTTAGKIYEAYG